MSLLWDWLRKKEAKCYIYTCKVSDGHCDILSLIWDNNLQKKFQIRNVRSGIQVRGVLIEGNGRHKRVFSCLV